MRGRRCRNEPFTKRICHFRTQIRDRPALGTVGFSFVVQCGVLWKMVLLVLEIMGVLRLVFADLYDDRGW